MNTDNPYKSPVSEGATATSPRLAWKTIGTGILFLGLALLAYGATAFWLINGLPPNGGNSGRLPSLYVMGAGIAVSLVGLVARDFRVGRKGR